MTCFGIIEAVIHDLLHQMKVGHFATTERFDLVLQQVENPAHIGMFLVQLFDNRGHRALRRLSCTFGNLVGRGRPRH